MAHDHQEDGCPYKRENQMPFEVADQSVPDHDPEAALLGQEREESSIPRTTTKSSWLYPSERMFYNALRRKGHEPDAPDIPPMLAIHNFLNEAVWQEVCKWEAINDPNCIISLERFWGSYGQWSPRSLFFTRIMNSPAPFDRHDWMIRRCDGQTVRYIIDYYPSNEGESVFNCDVRPAIDSFSALILRSKKAFIKWKNYFFSTQ